MGYPTVASGVLGLAVIGVITTLIVDMAFLVQVCMIVFLALVNGHHGKDMILRYCTIICIFACWNVLRMV